MNLICQLRDFFFREDPSVSSYDRLLADLNCACSHLPEGQAFLVTGDGEFTVRLTWKPQQTNPDKRMFSLNGQDEVTEWIEAVPTATKEPNPVDIEEGEKEPKQKRMMQRLSRYLKLHYAFRRENARTKNHQPSHFNVVSFFHLHKT